MPSTADHAEAHGVVALREPLRGQGRRGRRPRISAASSAKSRRRHPAPRPEAAPIGRAGATRQQLIGSPGARASRALREYQRLAGRRSRATPDRATDLRGGRRAPDVRTPERHAAGRSLRSRVDPPRRASTASSSSATVVLMLRREDGRLKIAGRPREQGTEASGQRARQRDGPVLRRRVPGRRSLPYGIFSGGSLPAS